MRMCCSGSEGRYVRKGVWEEKGMGGGDERPVFSTPLVPPSVMFSSSHSGIGGKGRGSGLCMCVGGLIYLF